ncbi:MAG: hypothetical protein ACLFP4_03985 [Spirochaetales bacterium]
MTDLPDVWMIEFPSSLRLNAPSGTTREVVFQRLLALRRELVTLAIGLFRKPEAV